MSNLKLYELADDYIAALNKLEALADAGMLDAETVANTLDGMSCELEVKATNVIGYARSLELEAQAIRAAIEPMEKRAKAIEAKSKYMIEYVKTQMERTGKTEIKSPYFVLKLRDNPPKVVIDNEAGIPETCWRVIPEKREVDKKAIKEMIESGQEVQFAHIERDKRLEIK